MSDEDNARRGNAGEWEEERQQKRKGAHRPSQSNLDARDDPPVPPIEAGGCAVEPAHVRAVSVQGKASVSDAAQT